MWGQEVAGEGNGGSCTSGLTGGLGHTPAVGQKGMLCEHLVISAFSFEVSPWTLENWLFIRSLTVCGVPG